MEVKTGRHWCTADFRHGAVRLHDFHETEAGAADLLLEKLIRLFRSLSDTYDRSRLETLSLMQEYLQYKPTHPTY